MHILLFNEYYPPDASATAKLAAQAAEAMAKRHKVTVVAGRPSYNPDEFYPFAFLRRDTRKGVVVECVGSTAYPRHQMRRRLSNYLTYLALAVPRAIALKPDIILAMTDPPVAGIAGAFVARRLGCPFVYNIQDMYPDMALGGHIIRPGIWVRYWERMHRRALKQAARVVVIGEDMRDRILSKGIAPERIAVVRNGTTLPETSPNLADPAVQEIVREVRCGFSFAVLHAGNLGFYGAWNTLLKAAEILRNENTGLVFIGEGANLASLRASASDLPNVRFLPFRAADQMPPVLLAGDVHVITVRRGLEGIVVPSKLYSILAAGRPVLAVAAANSDTARIVAESECGAVADPDDPAAVVAAIRRLRSDPAKLAEMGRRAREISSRYARVNELERFVGIIEDAARDSNRMHNPET
jgi:glycosyltransferase involved in cell wall biosynthesis